MRFVALGVAIAFTLACGSTGSDGGSGATAGASGAGGSGGSGAASGAAGASGSGGAAGALTPTPPDPGELRCGTEVCTLPGQVCCYESVSPGGVDRCLPKADCKAPNRACDEAADCGTGALCCTGLSVLPQSATVAGFAGTFCVDATSPGSCKPEAGIGKSSVPACKGDAECFGGQCIVESCYGYPLMSCGGSVDCK